MKNRMLLPTLIIAALLSTNLAIAGPGGCGSCSKGGGCATQGVGQAGSGPETMTAEQHQERTERRLEMMSTILELNAVQKQQLGELFRQRWQNNQQLREQLQASRQALREIKTAASFNETEFRAHAAQRAELNTEMMVRKIKFHDEVYALLDPEQREKADKLGGMLMGGNDKRRHGGKGQHSGQSLGI